ncbi:MAG: hypothetical protein WC437_04925 [Patescibacteria group bacterium]|jgi:hypothetical protein
MGLKSFWQKIFRPIKEYGEDLHAITDLAMMSTDDVMRLNAYMDAILEVMGADDRLLLRKAQLEEEVERRLIKGLPSA